MAGDRKGCVSKFLSAVTSDLQGGRQSNTAVMLWWEWQWDTRDKTASQANSKTELRNLFLTMTNEWHAGKVNASGDDS